LDATFERCQNQEESFAQLKQVLDSIPANECRYIFFRVDWNKVEDNGLSGGKRSKTVMISAVGHTAPVKSKLLFAACKEPMKRKMNCCVSELQTSLHGVSLDAITEKAMQYVR